MTNSAIAKVVAMMNKLMGVKNSAKPQPRKIGHEPTPQKRVRRKYIKPTNNQRTLIERKKKKARKMADYSRKINRLRGVGI